jgi:hypothetical protein
VVDYTAVIFVVSLMLTLAAVVMASIKITPVLEGLRQSDLLVSSGALDLTGLTIVPATDAEPTARTYVIAYAAGGIVGEKPAVSGFPSKYKVIRSGTELLLTSQGGTVMLLK